MCNSCEYNCIGEQQHKVCIYVVHSFSLACSYTLKFHADCAADLQAQTRTLASIVIIVVQVYMCNHFPYKCMIYSCVLCLLILEYQKFNESDLGLYCAIVGLGKATKFTV